jgi:hypothetical protein
MMQGHLLVSVWPVTSTNFLNCISLDLLLCPGDLNGFLGGPLLLDRLSLADLCIHFNIPFAIIPALATSITIADIALVGHLERIFPLIEVTHHAVSIVPAGLLALQLLLRFFVRPLVLLHQFLLAFIAPVLQPQAFHALVDVAHMLGPVAR